MQFDLFFSFICLAYFVGGITIGWFAHAKRKERRGLGRWDNEGRD